MKRMNKTERKLKEAVIGWGISMVAFSVVDVLIIRQPIAWALNIILSVGCGIVWYFTTAPAKPSEPSPDVPDMR